MCLKQALQIVFPFAVLYDSDSCFLINSKLYHYTDSFNFDLKMGWKTNRRAKAGRLTDRQTKRQTDKHVYKLAGK